MNFYLNKLKQFRKYNEDEIICTRVQFEIGDIVYLRKDKTIKYYEVLYINYPYIDDGDFGYVRIKSLVNSFNIGIKDIRLVAVDWVKPIPYSNERNVIVEKCHFQQTY